MTQLPAEVRHVLSRFRWGIRRYLFLEGLAALVTITCLMFWVTFGIDVAYYRLSRLELPSSFRLFALLVMMGILSGFALVWIFLRLLRKLRRKDLALALERRYPRLNDRLITTVELDGPVSSPLQAEMIARTRQEAVETLAGIQLKETFDQRPLRQLAIVATVLLITLAVFSVARAASMERWVHAYLLGKDNYWDPFRQQSLVLEVIAQPGERVQHFDENRTYKHPRGSDLQLRVLNVAESTPPENVDVQFVSFTSNGSHRGRLTMSRTAEDRFDQTISKVVDDHQLWVRGGDFVNRFPYRVLVVDPPQVDEITLECDYPSYTGLDVQEDQLVRVVGTQASLPMETQLILHANTNKPLLRVDVQCHQFQLTFGFERDAEGMTSRETSFTLLDENSNVQSVIPINVDPESLFTADRTGFRVPLHVTKTFAEQISKLNQDNPFPLPIAPDSIVKILLIDEDGIYSPEPASLMINGIPDRAPVVDTKRTGVGTLVTRNASLPIEGTLTDDYGLNNAWFGFRLGGSDELQQAELSKVPAGQREFVLDNGTSQRVERFDLRPLKLQEGQTLTLGVYAEDGDNINGPHIAHGELLNFKIVSDDELEAKLNDREINLRLRFEQIRAEVGGLRAELDKHFLPARAFDANPQEASTERSVLSAFVERSLHQLRKNHTESRSIEVAFRELRAERVNNNIHNRELLDRIDQGVISPLQILNDNLFDLADQRYALQRLRLQREAGIGEALQETVPAVDDVLAQMDRILENMRDRVSINELIQNLQNQIEQQRKLMEETENKLIEENFFFDLNQ